MSDVNMPDLLNYLQKEATRGAGAAQARDWLLNIASLDNATAEAQARLTQMQGDEAAAMVRLAALAQAEKDAAAKGDADRQALADELHDMRNAAQAQIAAAVEASANTTKDADAKAYQIIIAANGAAEKIKSDMLASLAGLKDEIAQATTDRDNMRAEAATAKAQLDEYNAASRAILARVQR